MLIQDQLIAFSLEIEGLRGNTSPDATERRDVVRENIKIIGRTAAFFGGLDAMKKLHDACEDKTGQRNEVGNVLNRTWDGIGGWNA